MELRCKKRTRTCNGRKGAQEKELSSTSTVSSPVPGLGLKILCDRVRFGVHGVVAAFSFHHSIGVYHDHVGVNKRVWFVRGSESARKAESVVVSKRERQ